MKYKKKLGIVGDFYLIIIQFCNKKNLFINYFTLILNINCLSGLYEVVYIKKII